MVGRRPTIEYPPHRMWTAQFEPDRAARGVRGQGPLPGHGGRPRRLEGRTSPRSRRGCAIRPATIGSACRRATPPPRLVLPIGEDGEPTNEELFIAVAGGDAAAPHAQAGANADAPHRRRRSKRRRRSPRSRPARLVGYLGFERSARQAAARRARRAHPQRHALRAAGALAQAGRHPAARRPRPARDRDRRARHLGRHRDVVHRARAARDRRARRGRAGRLGRAVPEPRSSSSSSPSWWCSSASTCGASSRCRCRARCRASAPAARTTACSATSSTGLFATLMATPCSAPFLGTAVGFGLSQSAGVDPRRVHRDRHRHGAALSVHGGGARERRAPAPARRLDGQAQGRARLPARRRRRSGCSTCCRRR